jgi:hypothetical protein
MKAGEAVLTQFVEPTRCLIIAAAEQQRSNVRATIWKSNVYPLLHKDAQRCRETDRSWAHCMMFIDAELKIAPSWSANRK